MSDAATQNLDQAVQSVTMSGAASDGTAGARRRRGWVVAGAALAPLAAGIAYSHLAVEHAAELPLAIEADRRVFLSPMAGHISYYADERLNDDAGESAGARERPLILIHSVNAGASAYEMRPLFDHFRGRRAVYALDLPGFGYSQRGDRVYSADLYAAALLDLLAEVGAERRGGADVVALSLSCEFAARAAITQPARVRSLALLSPSGLASDARENRTEQRAGINPASRWTRRLFAFPLWSQAFYDALVSRASLRYFLQRSFVGEVDPGLLNYAWATTHQPGARFAPLFFISGQLFTPNALATLYRRLTQPTLALYDRDGFVSFDALPSLLGQRENWQARRIAPTRGLPQFERLGDTARALQVFWSEAAVAQV